MKLGDRPSLYPFANLMVSADDLTNFLSDFEKRAQEKTAVYKDIGGVRTLVSWTMPSRRDTTTAILRWLADQAEKQSTPSNKQLLKG